MTANILDGKLVAANYQNEIKNYIIDNNLKHKITLAVILVGTDPASEIYVRNKKIACQNVGINAHEYYLPEESTEQQILDLIARLNNHNEIHGILLQLPLPKHLSNEKINSLILSTIDAKKDVDGFNPYNFGLLALRLPRIRPCTPKGIIKLLNHYNIPIKSKNITVVGASNIVGRPLALEMLIAGGTVTICHKFTTDLKQHCLNADILCTAVGIPNLIPADYIKPGATVIDIGITKLANGSLSGDVDFEQAKKVAKNITPVPGGVGPMTIAMLLENTIECYKLSLLEN
ncbi:MAG: bifunctional methylenetetrahydrofolate dehydrogenase/methenyltetrahydrofolate cyclohydrolase FolD [Gammaproteobacteria bacterium]|nr:bifunctional methylenetetrahydrofolate dehydrogenase/methenyltetrahydrofolate cyclohydrolase FolD [Gammaproteobacteria bacterium]